MDCHIKPGLVFACLTHVPLWVNYPPFVEPIYMGQAQEKGKLNLRDLAPEWEPYHSTLGGIVGNFALKNYIEQNFPNTSTVGICQYRKFVSHTRISRIEAPSYRSMDIVNKDILQQDILKKIMLPNNEEFLISHPLLFSLFWKKKKDYFEQFSKAHNIKDLLRFTSIAAELGIIDKFEVEFFFREVIFIPGGIELGVFPTEFWINGITAMENVIRECIRNNSKTHTYFQVRALSFCCERLGSYMLLKHFDASGSYGMRYKLFASLFPPDWIKRFAGQLNLIAPHGTNDYQIGT